MKRIIPLLLALLLLITSATAADIVRIGLDDRAEIDLDGDSVKETVFYKLQPDERGFEDSLQLFVHDAHGNSFTLSTEIVDECQLLVTDIDGDGSKEIFASGDVMSADYYTSACRFDESGLHGLKWRDCDREVILADDFIDPGYGYIKSLSSGNSVTLSGSQDILGTWFLTREFSLKGDTFDFCDDGRFIIDEDMLTDDWEYDCLILSRDLKGFKAGDKFKLSATDGKSFAELVSEAGEKLTLQIEKDAQDYGFYVEGLREEEVFEQVPYND